MTAGDLRKLRPLDSTAPKRSLDDAELDRPEMHAEPGPSNSPSHFPQNQQRMEEVHDQYSKVEHQSMDEGTCRLLGDDASTQRNPPGVVLNAVVETCPTLDQTYQNVFEARKLVEANEQLREKLIAAQKSKSFKIIRCLKILQPPAELRHDFLPLTVAQKQATELSWSIPFVGDSHDALFAHMKKHYNKENIYARYAAVVQSSGMGKSRMVDELGKKHFVVPICLGEDSSSGFPPPDKSVRKFLCVRTSQLNSLARACAFLEHLFKQLSLAVQEIEESLDFGDDADIDVRLVLIAATFREQMTQGQTMLKHGAYRLKFYKAVMDGATNSVRHYEKYLVGDNVKPSKSSAALPSYSPAKISPSHGQLSQLLFIAAFEELERRLSALGDVTHQSPTPGMQTRRMLKGETSRKPPAKKVKRQKTAESKRSLSAPLVILSYDEAHTLTKQEGEDAAGDRVWSPFGELRRALRSLSGHSLFSLFLSTTGKISEIASRREDDLSARVIIGNLHLIPPFTDMGFDQLAKRNKRLTLPYVTTDEYMASIARPLLSARHERGDTTIKKDTIKYAAYKLIHSPDIDLSALLPKPKIAAMLACLSQRLPIEFLSTTYLQHLQEREQVEAHMRVCLTIDSACESMVTVSPSEPLLSEAASWIMKQPSFDAPNALMEVLSGFSIHQGDRGELVGLLLITLARDQAMDDFDDVGRCLSRSFPVSVFLRSLFKEPSDQTNIVHHDALRPRPDLDLAAELDGISLYFNHIIKAHDFATLEPEHLVKLLARGAGVLCANNQRGTDAALPTVKGDELLAERIGRISFQFKNDPKVTEKHAESLFAIMDPEIVQNENENSQTVIVIRIIFSLAIRTPCFKFIQTTQAAAEPGKNPAYKTYDFWSAGLSPEILGPINPQQADVWKALLKASYGWEGVYRSGSEQQNLLRQSMNPGASTQRGFWQQFWPSDEVNADPSEADETMDVQMEE